jgi:hypothetical protein
MSARWWPFVVADSRYIAEDARSGAHRVAYEPPPS